MELKKVSDLQNADKIKADDLLMVVQNKEGVLTSTKSTTDEMKEFFNQGMVKSVNGETPDGQGNINIENSGIEEAPVDNRLYGRSNKSWIEIDYKPSSGIDSPKFLIDEPEVTPITSIVTMANTLYSVPLIAVSDQLSDDLTVTSSIGDKYLNVIPQIVKHGDGERYLVYNTSLSSGNHTIKITDNINKLEKTIGLSLWTDWPYKLYSFNTSYNKKNRIVTCSITYAREGQQNFFPAKLKFSMISLADRMNSDNSIDHNGAKIKFIPAWHHDVLGQFFFTPDRSQDIKFILDDSVEPGKYICSIYDIYKGTIIESIVTIDQGEL